MATPNIHFKDLEVEEVNWSHVRESVFQLNPLLAEAIDTINPQKKHTFFKARYSYGEKIVEKGRFSLPLKKRGELLSAQDPTLSTEISKAIGYSPIPLSLVLSNSNEVFVETRRRVVPLNYFLPGDLFGVFEVMNQLADNFTEPMWNVTAGARSVFLLPRINDAIGHNKIRKEFNCVLKPPQSLGDQFDIFREIALKTTNNDWRNEILIFTREWFTNENSQSVKFYKYLLNLCWKQIQLFRDSVESSLRWASFAEEIGNRNMKPRPYLIDMVRYLTSISHGASVAFMPAIDCSALPANIIQKNYIDVYGLKNYFPTLIQPTKFMPKKQPVYCSLSMPTILESSPHMRNAPSIMSSAREIKRLTQIFTEAVLKYHQLDQHDPIISTQYEFFHTEEDPYSELKSSTQIFKEDERFLVFAKQTNDRISCSNAPFFRGCIRIR
jgi:hypothetical protein